MNVSLMKQAQIRPWLVLALAGLCALAAAAQEQKAQPAKPAQNEAGAVTKLRIEVKAGDKDEPIDNASIYVKFTRERSMRKDEKIEMNTKTNRSGVAIVGDVPRGKVLVQVVAQGWKTFGQWYDLEKAEQTINIKLQRPTRWY